MKQHRLGKHPKKFDHRTLQLARYLPELPTPPTAIDHASRLPANIGMMGNDQYGDCTVAAAGHHVQSWSVYADRWIVTIPDADILAAYKIVSPGDDGAYALDVLNLWKKTGIGGDKIEGFVEIAAPNLTQMELAIEYFGGCYIGMSLPNVNTFGPWITPTGAANPYNGHMVALIGYDRGRRIIRTCTWGQVVDMSYEWFLKYCDEGYAILNDIALIQSSGKTPEGFDWAALTYDLNHIGDPVTPPGPVPPAPAPVPAGQMLPIFTAKSNPNYIVSLAGINQTPTHTSAFEAAEQAVMLKITNPEKVVRITTAGIEEVTLITI